MRAAEGDGVRRGRPYRVGVTVRRAPRSAAHPVAVRSLSRPEPGWTLERALEQLDHGYRLDHVAAVSGFHLDHLRTAHRTAARRAARSTTTDPGRPRGSARGTG